ncbi:hypothetical protein [Pseudomonas baetica]|uniref:hypothetical protein n=1 Tax=Pseudomonas baetica TaxID=674054 RepID=UPI0024055893|nr:hypothetical protein [Pseudomonas baetica]MDF9775221.1 hypothetical protein [Pseudomonas baetica]
MEKSRQIYCRWKGLSRTVTNDSRTGTAQNVALMKLNGAQDIKMTAFWPDIAPEWGVTIQFLHHQEYRLRGQARSHRRSVLN